MRLTREKIAAGAAGAVVALLALTGCGGGGDSKAETKVPATATGSLEDLAAEVKCKPDMQIDADEVRQALCKNTDGKFIFATFATDRGQREWVNGAEDYGGFYLVGAKWVAVGNQKMVMALRGQLGGTLEVGTSHHSGDSGGGGSESTHSDHRG